MSKLLDQGGYGCIFYPALSCNKSNKKNNKKKVSKVQLHNEAVDNEIHIGKLITSTIPKYKKRFLPIISKCALNITNVDNTSIDKCHIITSSPKDKYIMMNMDYLENIPFHIFLTSAKSDTIHRIISSYVTLAESFQILNNASILHHDVKYDNILISTKTLAPVIIDFGISIDMNIIKTIIEKKQYAKLSQYFYVDAPDYYPWSVEIHMLNHIIVNHIEINDNKELTVKEITTLALSIHKHMNVLEYYSKEFSDQYLIKLTDYMLQFADKPLHTVINDLFKTYMKWDVYSLSIIYIKMINYVFDNNYPLTPLLTDLLELHTINIMPDPNERMSWEKCISSINNIIEHTSESIIDQTSNYII
jgi:serine/threonine protein kinase